MKIPEVIKECRAKAESCRTAAEENKNGGFSRGRAVGHDECADMLDETVREIREELDKINKDIDLLSFLPESTDSRMATQAMATMLEWVLGEKE